MNSSRSSQEIEAELAVARTRERDQEQSARLLAIQAAIAGRCYAYTFSDRYLCRVVGYVRFMRNAKLSRDGAVVEITERRVWAAAGSTLKGAEVRRTESQVQVLSAVSAIPDHSREVSLEEFSLAWSVPEALGFAISERWAKAAGFQLGGHAPDEAVVPVFDAPHLVLSPSESSLLSGPFFVRPNCFLLTPNSRAYVAKKLDEAESIDRRCAGLYEACDMDYVVRQRAARATLRAKLAA